jgi:hypothetical protein
MTHKRTEGREALRPFLTVLDGTRFLMSTWWREAKDGRGSGRPRQAHYPLPDGHLAGVWDLERMTDDEAVAWGLWVAMKVRTSQGRGRTRTGATG